MLLLGHRRMKKGNGCGLKALLKWQPGLVFPMAPLALSEPHQVGVITTPFYEQKKRLKEDAQEQVSPPPAPRP